MEDTFEKTDLKGKCAIVTSYRPSPADIKGEETGDGLTEKLRQYGIYRKMLADYFDEPEDTAMHKAEQFEKEVKKRFLEEPGVVRVLKDQRVATAGYESEVEPTLLGRPCSKNVASLLTD